MPWWVWLLIVCFGGSFLFVLWCAIANSKRYINLDDDAAAQAAAIHEWKLKKEAKEARKRK